MMLDAFADALPPECTEEKENFVLYVVLGPVAHQSEGMVL